MSNQPKGRSGGVLQINASATKKSNSTQKSAQRSPAPRLRLIIRRLPPGLTEAEFWESLGSEWQTGKGKVDWQSFKEGKVSKDPSKPSRPGRAYIKVKDQQLIEVLSAKLKATSFKDAKNTVGDSCLVGPPSLEFAPYSKNPSGRNRHDGRQGTIDQDQEFIDFLQRLTEPITKPTTNGLDANDAKQEKVLTTPLVQFIKEKKANKAKEKEAAAAAKTSKKNQETKESKTKAEPRPTVVVKSNTAAPKEDKAKVTKAIQEAVKAANKSAVQIQNKNAGGKPTSNKVDQKSAKEPAGSSTPIPAPAKAPSSAPAQVGTPPATPPAKPERQRGNASAASRMIARDLGLAPKEPRTPRAARSANTTATPTTIENTQKIDAQQKPASVPVAITPKSTSSTIANTSTPVAPPSGPRNNRPSQQPQAKAVQPSPQPAQRSNKNQPQPAAGSKSAFLKHANPSQGITEELLRATFVTFGEVTRCEIDKKKGLGYIDFVEPESLKKAMAVSPIKIGNGQVIVLENKSPYKRQSGNAAHQAGTAASSSRVPSVASSRAVSAVTSPQPAPAVIATQEPKIAPVSTPTTVQAPEAPPANIVAELSGTQQKAPATPTGPKGGKGNNAPARTSRGGANSTPGRGAFSQSPRQGRAGFRGRSGRGNRTGGNAGTAAEPNPATSTAAAPSTEGGANNTPKPTTIEKS